MEIVNDNLNLISTNSELGIFQWLFGLLLTLTLSFIIQVTYRKYSLSVSNLSHFTKIFIPFTISVFLIISTIKASLALSLGLVGALSIIRFRTAIKEPEQLIYLFILIGIAISSAANQYFPSVVITGVFYLSQMLQKQNRSAITSENIQISLNHTSDFNFTSFLKDLIKNDSLTIERISNGKQHSSISINSKEISLEMIDEVKIILNEHKISDFNIIGFTKPTE
jgi:hypothetical protein